MRYRVAIVAALVVMGLVPSLPAKSQVGDVTAPAARDTEPVIMTGQSFPEWATLADQTARRPGTDGTFCAGGQDDSCTHNQYEDPDFSSQEVFQQEGTPIDRLLGYKWDDEKNAFVQIPFQIDELFQRYLSNNNSGFAFYSETDQHTTYAFDREGFRWTDSDPDDPCMAVPASDVAKDPVPGLDTDDELVFMASDAGVAAPSDAPLPAGIEGSYQVEIHDPTNPTGVGYAYVMKAAEGGPEAAFDASNGYVRYARDTGDPEKPWENANAFKFSESNYEDYGATFHGPWYDDEGVCHSDESEWKQHRPSDKSTISTPRYEFRYEGRWLMTELHVSANDDWTYGPDIIDQWKARAFQQRPSGETPCCGFEEEVNNWGGSSILMGERSGPVRTIRETWGADSGTNVVRRETFYRDEIRQTSYLRVHVIPPADGIYAQWDYNAGMVTTYFNPENPDGVAIDGKNDEVFGNSNVHVGPDGFSYEGDDEASDQIEEANGGPVVVGSPQERGCDTKGLPGEACIANDIDTADPTFSGMNAGLNWEEVAGPNGTLVSRTQLKQVTPGSGQGVIAIPYYRDDACFDDGTGSNPGPHLHGHGTDEGPYGQTSTGEARRCWDSSTEPAPDPAGDERYLQGSVGTHGVHILFIAESDNARAPVPLTEIDSEQRIVVLKPTLENVGEQYGRSAEKPLAVFAGPELRDEAPDEEPTESPSPTPTPSPTPSSSSSSPSSTPTPTPSSTSSASPSPSSSPTQAPSQTSVAFADSSSESAHYSDPATISARLTGKDGTPISAQRLGFAMRGNSAATTWNAITDKNGVATSTFDVNLPPGAYELSVHYDGTSNRMGASDIMSFVVYAEDTVLNLTARKSRRLVAILADADGGALSDKKVVFTVGRRVVGTKRTNGGGRAKIAIPRRHRDDLDRLRALFEGDDFYMSSSTRLSR